MVNTMSTHKSKRLSADGNVSKEEGQGCSTRPRFSNNRRGPSSAAGYRGPFSRLWLSVRMFGISIHFDLPILFYPNIENFAGEKTVSQNECMRVFFFFLKYILCR